MTGKLEYLKGEEVTVLNVRGETAGKGRVESYDVQKHAYKVWFLYPGTEEKELIELPALLVANKKAGMISGQRVIR